MTPLERVRMLEEMGPRRLTGSALEKAVQTKLGEELEALGFSLQWRPFTFPQHLYFGLLVTFGLALAGTYFYFYQPAVGLALHALCAISYTSESLRRVSLVRSLLPKAKSQNLVATRAARAPLRKRVVLLAHSDAAFTGFLFHPKMIWLATRPPPPGLPWLRKQLGLAVLTVTVLAVLDGLALGGVWHAPALLVGLLSIPSVIIVALNLDVVLRNRVVPGACDNLSGCSTCVELAERMKDTLPDDVELNIVITGCEEAGTGGAIRLAEEAQALGWSKDNTTVLGLDTLSNGTLRYVEEGELWRIPVPAGIKADIDAVSDAGPLKVPLFIIPTGATDALPFVVRGWNAASLTCVDEHIGAPREYHYPTDTWANIDETQLGASIDFAHRLLKRLTA